VARHQEDAPSQSLLNTESRLELEADLPLAADEADTFAATRVGSPTKDAWQRFRHNWAAMISLAVILAIIIMAIFAPFMHTANPLAQNFDLLDQGPSLQHWFGTDATGRDQYTRLVFGLRVPLIVGILGTVITVIVGTLLGLVSGYFGGLIDGDAPARIAG